MYSCNEIISSIQRNIISGLVLFTENLEEIQKRVEITKEILTNYKDYFTKKQILIVKFVYRDYLKMQKEGYFAFGISEISEKILFRRFNNLANEYIEILSYSPLVEDLMMYYLKELEKEIIKLNLGVAI